MVELRLTVLEDALQHVVIYTKKLIKCLEKFLVSLCFTYLDGFCRIVFVFKKT